MRGIVIGFFLLWGCMTGLTNLSAQELRAAVTVKSSAVQGGHSDLFHSLEESLHALLNGHRWGDSFTQTDHKTLCTFTLLVTERLSSDSFRGELYVHAATRGDADRAGVTLLVVRDKEIDFSYTAYQPLTFDRYAIRDNLTAVAAYYSCLILALERDATEALGGTPFFRMMEQIASGAASHGWRGWEMSRRPGNRTAIAASFNDGSLEEYRLMWHRLHSQPHLTTAAEAVGVLHSLHRERPGHPMLTLFADAGLQDLVSILARDDRAVRKQWLALLSEIYPTRNEELEMLRE